MIPLLENKKVEGFTYLKIKKATKCPFMLLDRYEIHIQALVDFINGKLIIFSPHLHENIFEIYIQKTYRK